MLGTDGRLYDEDYDFDGDGKLNGYEYSIMDDEVFGTYDVQDEDDEDDSVEDELSMFGLDVDELRYMDEDERRKVLEDEGLDPDDYDDVW